jgi:hypothetical protein
MPFVTKSEKSVAASPEAAFDQLADLPSWTKWMPRSFRPVGQPKGALGLGRRFRVRIAGSLVATKLEVSALHRPMEIAWRGGMRGLLWAEHCFVFEPEGATGTRVRSVETWYGILAPLVRRIVQPVAERIAGEQLAGLAAALQRGAG